MPRKAGTASKAESVSETKSAVFDPAVFLEGAGHGRSKAEYLAGVVIYAQGDVADAVFHVTHGKVKIAVTNGVRFKAMQSRLGLE